MYACDTARNDDANHATYGKHESATNFHFYSPKHLAQLLDDEFNSLITVYETVLLPSSLSNVTPPCGVTAYFRRYFKINSNSKQTQPQYPNLTAIATPELVK